MATRKASFDADDDSEHPIKRRRVLQQEEQRDSAATDPPSPRLDTLNDDCLLRVFSYSATQDLNNLAMVNRRLCAIRAHESLDQTREGILTITDGCTFESFCNTIVDNDWAEDFQGNRTKMKIVGAEGLLRGLQDLISFQDFQQFGELSQRSQLPGVSSLELTGRSDNDDESWEAEVFMFGLSCIFPRLQEVDLSGFISRHPRALILGCSDLSRFTMNGNGVQRHFVTLTGSEIGDTTTLTEISLDGGCFQVFMDGDVDLFRYSSMSNADNFMLQYCRHLERLSIKNATYGYRFFSANEAIPIPQEILVKMVRLHPTLRWLRSDLTTENVAMLRQERPDITFVTE